MYMTLCNLQQIGLTLLFNITMGFLVRDHPARKITYLQTSKHKIPLYRDYLSTRTNFGVQKG